MGESDIETLLHDGYWANSRALSLDSRKILETPRRSKYSPQDNRAIPRTMVRSLYSQKPPPPSVEDEYDALAKEAGSVVSSVPSEEPSNRGDPDQCPILVPVHDPNELNPERRFILLSNPSASADDPPHEEKPCEPRRPAERSTEPDLDPASYEANTGRKYGSSPSSEDKTNKNTAMGTEREYRRTRPEILPPIIQDGGDERRPHDTRRAKSTTRTEGGGEDYPSPRLSSASSRYPRENLITPEVIEYAANGRERPYYRAGSSPVSRSRHRSAHTSEYDWSLGHDRKYKEREPQLSTSPSPEIQRRQRLENRYTRPDSRGNCETFRFSHHSPTKRERRIPPHYFDTFFQSEDESRPYTDYYRRSAMSAGKTDYLDTGSRVTGRRKARKQSPLPSPRLSQYSLADAYPNHSSTRRARSPREPRVSARSEKVSPRASTGTSFGASRNLNPPTGSVAAAIGSASNPNISADPRRSAVTPLPRTSSMVDSRVRPPTPSAAASTHSIYPPSQLQTPKASAIFNTPIGSRRRYSKRVKKGELSEIPPCPRTREEAGNMDWLTLPHCENFNICPSCYNANFAPTEFAHHFVPTPFRPRDRPIACDFGASEFYRIAWLFTRKYGIADLGLLYNLAEIAARGQPCTGPRQTSRIWYSIKDSRTRRPIDEFTVCATCAQSVEALLPKLAGIFMSLDTPMEPSRSVCAMHPDNRRFPLYFDMLEDTVDRALEMQSPPNIQALADRISQLATVRPCVGSNVLRNAYWHTMRSVPDFIACPECFVVVVRPLIDSHEDLTVAGNFHHVLTQLPEGQCMLFSHRMRDVFDRAVRKRDLAYLDAKVGERIDKGRECNARLDAVRRQGLDASWAKSETARILQEWSRYE
ncbi:hypothetical protein GGS21DRAFT_341598 [Xylaria nigripes]|nr:hypothetical protein GGS21DRAFT_341598 [Xylaria nigripes]